MCNFDVTLKLDLFRVLGNSSKAVKNVQIPDINLDYCSLLFASKVSVNAPRTLMKV
jgi:hypothetical protein